MPTYGEIRQANLSRKDKQGVSDDFGVILHKKMGVNATMQRCNDATLAKMATASTTFDISFCRRKIWPFECFSLSLQTET